MGWPYSSVKQMAARLSEGEMDLTFLVNEKIAKQDKENMEKRVTEVPVRSIKQVQHRFFRRNR